MRAQHDWRLLGGGQSDHLEIPLVRCNRVRDVAHDFAWKTLLAVRVNN
jgi:hypothetical protein